MTIDYIKQNKKYALILLVVVSAMCVVLIPVKVTAFFVEAAKASNLLENALAQTRQNNGEAEKRLADAKVIAEKVKKNNLFAPPAMKQHPVNAVAAIMGNEVLINEQWYRLGDMVSDAKIVAIEPMQVRILWDGQERTFAPVDAPLPERPSQRPGTTTEVAKATGSEEGRADVVQVQVDVGGAGGPPRMGMFGNMSQEEMSRMREQFMRMGGQMGQRFGGRGPGGEGGRSGGGRGQGRGMRPEN
jgi:hypothetical protein